MRREFLVGTALMSFLLTTVNAVSQPVFSREMPGPETEDVTKARMNVTVAPTPLISKDKILGSAYYDTLSILSSANPCSDFFGGPASVDIFNKLISKVRKGHFPASLGIQLSGSTINILNAETPGQYRIQYRIFDELSINTNGPFYKKARPDETSVHRIGRFNPSTREVRVLMLLHELGHALKGPKGNWLLADDGKDPDLSRLNTERVEKVCGDQIKRLAKAAATTSSQTSER